MLQSLESLGDPSLLALFVNAQHFMTHCQQSFVRCEEAEACHCARKDPGVLLRKAP